MSGYSRPYPLYELPHCDDLLHMIRQQVQEDANRVAFRFRRGKQLDQRTIGEFSSDIDALGTWLMARGLAGKHIALVAPNAYPWLVAYFAVLGSGSVIVPIDKDLPAEELGRLLSHSESVCAFAADKLAATVAAAKPGIEVHSFSELDGLMAEGRARIAAGDRAFIDHPQDVNRLATIVYTSGTTGGSKGVMLTQANMLADINQGCRYFDPEGPSLSVLPWHHMFGLVVALMMLVNWRSTVFINTGLKYLLPDFQESKPVTTMMVPLHIQTFHKMVMETARKEGKLKKLRFAMKLSLLLYKLGIDVRAKLLKDVRKPFGGELKYILVGGAALDPFYEKEFRAWGIDLIVAYGATECSPGIACNRNHYHRDGSVGLMVLDCEARIADDGEVLIRGPIVMQGYWHDEEATKAALKDGWYCSGDLGHVDADGFVYLTGRKKNLIILSDGENVSPEALEAKIGLIEGVSEVLVYQEGDEIAAEIFPDERRMGDQAHFDAQIAKFNESLPPAQRIRRVVLREKEFPKNTSRKILRHEARKESKNA